MKRRIVIGAVLLVVAAIVVGGWWYASQNPSACSWIRSEFEKAIDELGLGPEQETQEIAASGFIEAQKVSVSTDVGGRIVALYGSEGEQVGQGDVLVELDSSLLLAQIEMAEADLELAEATLALVQAGVRDETLAHAEAQVAQAEAAREAARVAWSDAQAMLANPQELELAMTAARAQVSVLSFQVLQAQAVANSAQEGRNLSDELLSMLENSAPLVAPGVLAAAEYEQALATYRSWAAWTGVDQAEVALEGAKRYLEELNRQRVGPLDLEAEAHAAEAQYEVANAAVELAVAHLEGLKLGASPEQIAAAKAQVQVARTGLAALQVQLAKLTLKAPISGLVLECPVHTGELATPGVPLVTLADLDELTLTIYVAEDEVGRIQLGQPVSVTVDAYPERVFSGAVTWISNQAEFTPKNVQTQEERVSMVFGVEVGLPNPDHALKPGMPADAILPETAR